MSESWEDQRLRLEAMASGNSKWDLSPNDRAAIRAALDRLKRCPSTSDEYRCQREEWHEGSHSFSARGVAISWAP